MAPNRRDLRACCESAAKPQLRRKPHRLDPFRGNVKGYGEILFAYAMIYAILIATFLLTGFSAVNDLSGRAQIAKTRTPFEQTQVQTSGSGRENLLLYAPGDSVPFQVSAYQESGLNWERFLESARGARV